jgi:hypothetical protein
MKALLRISTVVVLLGSGVMLSAGVVVVSAGTTAGWAAAMAASASTAIAESGITYIRRFIRSPYVDFQLQSVGLIT